MRLFVFLHVPFVLFLGLLLLLGVGRQPPTVQAQAVDATNPRQLFLPLITKPSKPPKTRSGIHLGNRGSSDWRAELFTLITGTVAGTWPSAVVIRSDQVFNFHRYPKEFGDKKCRIKDAYLKLTGEGEPYNAFKYLTAAIKAGTKVVIRIAPSPGNFADYEYLNDLVEETNLLHTLKVDEQPAGGNYCDETGNGGFSQEDKLRYYRDIKDIAQEMSAVYTQVVSAYGWPAQSLFFEPANEPNYEWYQKYIEKGKTIDTHVDNKKAWIAMDNYFAALYDLAKSIEPSLQILSPSMSQKLYGEQYFLGTCDPMPLVGGDGQGGMDYMTKTFGVDLYGNPLTPKADGFAIHNYWREGGEVWLPPPPDYHTAVPVVHFHCQAHRNDPTKYKPPTYHLLQYLSAYLLNALTRRPTLITEADLLSNCQDAENLIQYKDRSPEAPDFPYRTKQSLLTFTNQAKGQSETESIRYGADYVIVWLLINQAPNEATRCATNYEINWHEAYWEDANRVYEREWFPLWWAAAP